MCGWFEPGIVPSVSSPGSYDARYILWDIQAADEEHGEDFSKMPGTCKT